MVCWVAATYIFPLPVTRALFTKPFSLSLPFSSQQKQRKKMPILTEEIEILNGDAAKPCPSQQVFKTVTAILALAQVLLAPHLYSCLADSSAV